MTNNHNLYRRRRIYACCLFFLSISLTLSAQDLLVSGQVTDGQLPISGANVLIKNTNTGVVSDFDGRYTITAKPSDSLQISYLGYTTLTIPIQNRSTINVTLKEDATALGEVQINAGYYTTTDREKTGSIARITAKDIEGQPVNNPLGAMQGYMSGVNIVQNTGVPGGGYDIQIRGQNFINGATDPLFIVDGVPYGSQSLGSIAISVGINQGNTSPLNAINPNDIESIEVLKDADATAIYGSRAANGVVLITTKKGKQGQTKFNLNMSSSLGTVSHFLDLLNTEQYVKVRREAIINDGRYDIENPAYDFIWPDVKTWDQNRYTDWQKELIGGTAYRKNMQLSVSGGSEQTQFLISGAHQNETTVFPGDSRYKKTSLHNTLNHQSKNQRFKINLSTVYSIEDNRLPRTDLTGKAYTTEPNAPALYDGNGQLNWENNSFDNPLAALEEKYQADVYTLIMNAGISYQIIPSLELKTSLGYTSYNLGSYRLLPNTARLPSYGFTPETYSNTTTNTANRTSWIVEPQLNWQEQWGNLKLNAVLGTTFQQQSTDQLVLNARGFPNNNLLLNLAAAKGITVMEDSDSEYAYQAFFGRINFNWKDKYFINLTGRRDGSSRFGSGKQFGNFGAIGAAWLFSEEELLNHSSVLSFGKLRSSFGTTGSDNIGDYKFLDTYKVTGADYNGTTVLEPNGILNSEFGWESNQKLEAALELGFFNDRLILNSAWYKNRSSNQLIGIPLAHTTGFSELTGNFNATVENTGLEFDVISRNIIKSNFKWTTVFNLTIPKNKLVEFPGLETSTFANQLIIGQPVTVKHFYHALGVDPETGIYQFEDYNNDGVINSSGDKKWVEDLSPEFYGGLGNTMTYKNLKLDVFFQFKKQKAYNVFRSVSNPGYRRNVPIQLLDYWQNPGDITPIMQATMGYNSSLSSSISQQQSSNAAVSDASFIRLRNVSLTYQVPQHMLPAIDLSFYLQGQNLWTITSYDGPDSEMPSMIILPPLRQITLGAQIGF